MAGDMTVLVRLRMRDEMGGNAAKVLQGVQRSTGDAANAAKALGREATKSDTALQGMARSAAKVNQSNATGLANSLRHVDRMATAATQRLKQMGTTAANALKGAGQVGSGLAAGGYVASRALAKPMEYERRLAQMANTAYSERDSAGRRAGMAQLDASVTAAVRQGGGTRDEAAEALDKMLASGAIKADTASSLLPVLQKYATASGAGSGDLADIAIRGIQQGFFKPEQAQEALDKAMVAGQMGGFELKDMARWLPQMMANAQGMKSMQGFERILASAQASAITAGSKDQAGNNVVNLLAKLNSSDTASDFKKQGIDLSGSLAKARAKGELPIDAFVRLIEEKVVGKDKRFQALKAKAASAKGTEREGLMNDMADILQASAVGKVVQDRQALLALVAEMGQKGYVAEVLGGMKGAQGAGQTAFDVVASTSAFKGQQVSNEKDIASSRMLAQVQPALNPLLDGMGQLAARYPGLTTATVAATTAIGAMAAAAAAFGGAGLLMRGGGAAGAAGKAAGTVANASATVPVAGRATAIKVGGVAALATGAMRSVMTESSDMSRADKNAAHMATAGSGVGTVAGTALGATLGSVVPVVGTAVGGMLGGIAGGWLGDILGQKLGDLIFKDESTVRVESKLVVDGRELATAVNEVQERDSRRR